MELIKNKYHDIFWNEIRKLSCNINGKPNEILQEWRFSHKMNVETLTPEECLCTHDIHTIYFYSNVLNGNLIKVGSKCIEYWTLQRPVCDCGGRLSWARINKSKSNCPSCEKAEIKLKKEEQRKKELEERDKQLAAEQAERTKRIEEARVKSEELLKQFQETRENNLKQIELERLGNYRVFWYCPCRNMLFKEVIGNEEWATALINVPDDKKNESLQKFERYCRLLDMVEDL
jgi:hypothetical protein